MKKLFNAPNFGLLFIRVSLGVMMIFHGIPMLLGGKAGLTSVGGTMAIIGISFAPLFWGLMAALSYLVGGVCYILGFLFRPICLVFVFDMVMATLFHMYKGDKFSATSHAVTLGLVFFGLLFVGPGKYSIDKE